MFPGHLGPLAGGTRVTEFGLDIARCWSRDIVDDATTSMRWFWLSELWLKQAVNVVGSGSRTLCQLSD